jgi:hypothetical protein
VALPLWCALVLKKVVFTTTELSVGLKNEPPLLAGKLHKRVSLDESFWTLEDGKEVYAKKTAARRLWCAAEPGGDSHSRALIELDRMKGAPSVNFVYTGSTMVWFIAHLSSKTKTWKFTILAFDIKSIGDVGGVYGLRWHF